MATQFFVDDDAVGVRDGGCGLGKDGEEEKCGEGGADGGVHGGRVAFRVGGLVDGEDEEEEGEGGLEDGCFEGIEGVWHDCVDGGEGDEDGEFDDKDDSSDGAEAEDVVGGADVVFEGGGDEAVDEDEAECDGRPDADGSGGHGRRARAGCPFSDSPKDSDDGTEGGGGGSFSEGLDEGVGVGVVFTGELGDGHSEGAGADEAGDDDDDVGAVAGYAGVCENEDAESKGSYDREEVLGGPEETVRVVEGRIGAGGDEDVREGAEGEDIEDGFVAGCVCPGHGGCL